jgi:hypothetical protein
VPILEVASSWLESLFSKEMNISDLSRLWGMAFLYFSLPSFDLSSSLPVPSFHCRCLLLPARSL